MDWLKDSLVFTVSLVAIFTDAKWRKIPNWLTFSAIAAGIIVNCLNGWDSLMRSVVGLAMALVFMLPLFSLDFLKAGDVKLIVAWGAIKGLGQPFWQSFALWAFLYGALIGGIMSVVFLAMSKTGSEGRKRFGAFLSLALASPQTAARFADSSPLKMPMPYGIPLSLGAFLTIALERWFGMPCPFIVG
ncbi:MAG: prepilin peptidase [Armatimonadetes bacterium]|nr:prepilin peptidase [Armatimonadota bacterium]MDW8028587.1 prepilin peptidase [Armatimonadota bacterium]